MEREDDLDTVVAKLADQATNFNVQRFHCAIEIKVKSHILNLFIFVLISFSSFVKFVHECSYKYIYILKLDIFYWQHLLVEAVSYRQNLTKSHMSSIEIEAKVICWEKLLKLYLITTMRAKDFK